jgi:hypothetical protein
MTKNRVGRLVSIAAVLLLTLGILGGCSDDEPSADEPSADEPSADEANEEVCAAREDLTASVRSLADIDPATVTKDDLKATRDEIGDSLSDMEEAARKVAATETDELRTAFDDFTETIDGLEDDQSLSQYADEIVASATEVGVAFRAVFNKAGCS